MPPKNSGGSSIHRTAQTTFVRVVTSPKFRHAVLGGKESLSHAQIGFLHIVGEI